jgi:hypothetical protein
MNYIRVKWIHANPDDPIWLFSEIDEDRWEVRKVEIFKNGRTGFANHEESVGGTFLGKVPIPPLAEIAADPQFEPVLITAEEFNEVWAKRQERRRFEVLPGLPTSGPVAESFSATGQGKHREGYVVRFLQKNGESWVGNFQRGIGYPASPFNCVLEHPDGVHLIVISAGQGYVVDPENRNVVEVLGNWYETAHRITELNLIVLGTPIDLVAIGSQGRVWQTKRVSWDGMRNLAVTGCELRGEGCDPLNECWKSFCVDLRTGDVKGGAYNEPF